MCKICTACGDLFNRGNLTEPLHNTFKIVVQKQFIFFSLLLQTICSVYNTREDFCEEKFIKQDIFITFIYLDDDVIKNASKSILSFLTASNNSISIKRKEKEQQKFVYLQKNFILCYITSY